MTGHFEAKKHAYRQTQDGIVVSFVIHPNDLDAGFAVAPLGTRYMVGFAEIGDDGKPLETASLTPERPIRVSPEVENAGSIPAPSPKEKRPFASLPLSQQAAIRCGDSKFQEYVASETNEEAAAYVRKYCAVKSRSELDIPSNDWPRSHWQSLETNFQSWLTDQRYAEARR